MPTRKVLVIILCLLAFAETAAAAGLSYGFRIGPSTSGKTLASETARLEKGQKIEEILLDRFKASEDLGL